MIRNATEQDCENLAALSIKVWLETYAKEGIRQEYAHYALSTFTPEYFSSLLEDENYQVLVSIKEDYLQGFVVLNLASHYQSPDNGFELEKLYVDAPFRGKGVGIGLLTQMADKFGHNFWLYTWVENPSNAFYLKSGFKQIGTLTFDFARWSIENNVWLSPGHTLSRRKQDGQ